jgi:hypothetical protein
MGKKRLGDLYRTHVTVECEDGTGTKIPVALVKINRLDNERIQVTCNAIRAKVLMRRNDQEHELWLEAYGEIAERPREDLVRLLTRDDLNQRRISAEAEEAALPRWSDDDYLDGLRTAWKDGLMDTWTTEPDDPDAKRVFDELSEFNAGVETRLRGVEEDLAASLDHLDDEEIRLRATNKVIEGSANIAWLREFETLRLFYATRDPLDRGKRYFNHPDEIRDLDERIYNKLMLAYEDLTMDVMEGKESRPTSGSSPPSGPQDEEATSPSSGPEESPASRTSQTSS